jgi:DNA-binding NarL/FixJ family response regulator
MIRAVLVENVERLRRIYRRLFERVNDVELVEVFAYPEALLERLDQGLRVDVIVMDVRMDDELDTRSVEHIDGIEAAKRIRMRFPRMPILLYSFWDSSEYYRRVEEARFTTRYAFVKRYSLDDWDRVGDIIRLICNGQIYIDPEIRVEMDLRKERSENSPLRLLDDADQGKVLALMADGLSNDQIAHAMARKLRWVEDEISAIYTILQLPNDGGGDSRRIRAVRMFQDDRLLQWQTQPDGVVTILAQDRHGEWRPLDDIKREEREAEDDARIISTNAAL